MRMNAVETAVMNNPVRRVVQRFYEAPLLRRLGGDVSGGAVLEIGCGQGYDAELICHVSAPPASTPSTSTPACWSGPAGGPVASGYR